MSSLTASCCILNNGPGGWAFEALARQLANALWVDVAEEPRQFNYLLHLETGPLPPDDTLFIPRRGIKLAADKRLQAEVFARQGVPTPRTWLADNLGEVEALRRAHAELELCLKYPLGCGASGHRLVTEEMRLPASWPTPLVVQEFIRLERPVVYRLYGAGNALFGWIARRFPESVPPSPWVAHVRGARYARCGEPPAEAVAVARAALTATDLLASFGCVDLLPRPTGEWLALEVGTDGLVNHVDRDLNDPEREREIQQRIAEAFWARVGPPPWGSGNWRPREVKED